MPSSLSISTFKYSLLSVNPPSIFHDLLAWALNNTIYLHSLCHLPNFSGSVYTSYFLISIEWFFLCPTANFFFVIYVCDGSSFSKSTVILSRSEIPTMAIYKVWKQTLLLKILAAIEQNNLCCSSNYVPIFKDRPCKYIIRLFWFSFTNLLICFVLFWFIINRILTQRWFSPCIISLSRLML